MEVPEETIQSMLKDASQPITFDSFAMMMCFKTMELEPEIVLLFQTKALAFQDQILEDHSATIDPDLVESLKNIKTSN